MSRTTKAAKLLERMDSDQGITGRDLRQVLTQGQIWDFHLGQYTELGKHGGQQVYTALLFLAAGVEPEEFL